MSKQRACVGFSVFGAIYSITFHAVSSRNDPHNSVGWTNFIPCKVRKIHETPAKVLCALSVALSSLNKPFRSRASTL